MVTQVEKLVRKGLFANLIVPRIEDVIFMAIFISVVGLGSRLLNMDGDLGRHLTIGNYMLDSFSIPTRDIFSHTMVGLPLTPHEWIAQLVFSIAHRIAGLDGVVLLSALVIGATFTLVYKQCMVQSSSTLISILMTILAAAAASVHWLARPHIFTLLFTVLWIGQLEKFRKTGGMHLWSLPVIMIIWVNFHGAFIAGFVIWGIYLVNSLLMPSIGEEVGKYHSIRIGSKELNEPKTLILTGLLSLFVTLINPSGWRIWETTIGFLRNGYLVGHTVEYMSPDFHQVYFWPFLAMISLSFLLISIQGKRLSISSVMLVIVWTAMGLVSARNVSIYAVIAAPILAGISSVILNKNHKLNPFSKFDAKLRSIDRSLSGYLWPAVTIIMVAILLLGGVNLDFSGDGNQFLRRSFPVSAIDWVQEYEELGPVFNYFPWGGYLLFRLWPDQQVFIDGQTDFYGEGLTRQYEQVITLQTGWQEVLSHYKVQWVIMPTDSRLVKSLSTGQDWVVSFQDETATILTRAD